MSLLIGALTLGFIFSLIALGVLISFRIFSFPDITADGSSTLGAALAAILLVNHVHPAIATAAGFAGGFLAGTLTGTLATKFRINGLLSGILVMTGLYSVNLRIMGRSNVSLMGASTLANSAERAGGAVLGQAPLNVMGWEVTPREASMLLAAVVFIVLAGCVMYVFFQTNIGTAMRATGDNAQMVRALGVNDDNMIILGLGVSNALVALGGALLAQSCPRTILPLPGSRAADAGRRPGQHRQCRFIGEHHRAWARSHRLQHGHGRGRTNDP